VPLTVALTWIVSVVISSPIALGANYTARRSESPTLCTFYNADFIIYSSMGSFYVPCVAMLLLYWKIFRVINDRVRRTRLRNAPASSQSCDAAAAGTATSFDEVLRVIRSYLLGGADGARTGDSRSFCSCQHAQSCCLVLINVHDLRCASSQSGGDVTGRGPPAMTTTSWRSRLTTGRRTFVTAVFNRLFIDSCIHFASS